MLKPASTSAFIAMMVSVLPLCLLLSLAVSADAASLPPMQGDPSIQPTDYADTNNWMVLTPASASSKPVDIFVLYPTAYEAGENDPKVAAIGDRGMRDGARGVVICSTADRRKYSFEGCWSALFPPGIYHHYDLAFHYYNLRQNAQNRIARYLAANPRYHR